jgi:predicted nucleotidyltransferase
MYITAEQTKDIVIKIVDNLPEENEKLLEEESKIAEPKILPEPSQPLALAILDHEPLKEQEISISDFMFEFEDELFDDYGNTSKYHMMKKP